MLQLSSTLAAPEHFSPPCLALTFSVRVLVFIPPPHVLEHNPFCHSSHSQSTTGVNQYCYPISFRCYLLWFLFVPNRINRMKSIYIPGHGIALHSSTSVGWPLQDPPLASTTDFVRVLVRVPVPHDLEQSPWVHSSHTQCIAEGRENAFTVILYYEDFF